MHSIAVHGRSVVKTEIIFFREFNIYWTINPKRSSPLTRSKVHWHWHICSCRTHLWALSQLKNKLLLIFVSISSEVLFRVSHFNYEKPDKIPVYPRSRDLSSRQPREASMFWWRQIHRGSLIFDIRHPTVAVARAISSVNPPLTAWQKLAYRPP